MAKRIGKVMKVGEKWMSTYPSNGNAMRNLINDFYGDAMSVAKSAGFAGYSTSGMFNAIMGKEIMAGVFASDNMFTAIGARPYDHEGVRIMYELAQKGGIGAGTIQDGNIPDSVMAPIKELRQPYKELPYAYDIGLSISALQDKDDVASYQQYVDLMAATYADGLDYDLLRRTEVAQPVESSKETTLNGISRVIGSSLEVDKTYNEVQVTEAMVSPYGGSGSDIYTERSSKRQNNFNGYVNNEEGTLSLEDFNKCYAGSAMYWKQFSPDNKVWGMSIVALEKMGALMSSKNMWLESVFVQRDFNGVKTAPGRDVGGMLANSYRNIPIIVDGNYNYDEATQRVGDGMGEIHLLDLDHIWLSMLTPVEYKSTQDYAITRKLREQSVMTMRAETRIDRFLGHGKIVNKTAQ